MYINPSQFVGQKGQKPDHKEELAKLFQSRADGLNLLAFGEEDADKKDDYLERASISKDIAKIAKSTDYKGKNIDDFFRYLLKQRTEAKKISDQDQALFRSIDPKKTEERDRALNKYNESLKETIRLGLALKEFAEQYPKYKKKLPEGLPQKFIITVPEK